MVLSGIHVDVDLSATFFPGHSGLLDLILQLPHVGCILIHQANALLAGLASDMRSR